MARKKIQANTKKSPLDEEAKKMGYFTKNKKGDTYIFQFAIWRASKTTISYLEIPNVISVYI